MIRIDYLSVTILFCIDRFCGERSLSAVYNVLAGKKSTQITQDIMWYNLEFLYKTFPHLTEENFEIITRTLQEKQLIKVEDKGTTITSLGKKILDQNLKENPMPKYLNGWRFHKVAPIFWSRLSLAVQVLSNWAYGETKFFPVERNIVIQEQIRTWLKRKNPNKDKAELVNQFHAELFHLLKKAEKDQISPDCFVYKLTGFHSPGMTDHQLAQHLGMDEDYFLLSFQQILHYILDTIWKNQRDFPLLWSLIPDLSFSLNLSRSATMTYNLWQEGRSMEEIARIRQIKRNTVQDHIVEIALVDPDFSIDPFVDRKVQRKIMQAVKSLNTKKLRRIKDVVPEAEYFEIRLVLSKYSQRVIR